MQPLNSKSTSRSLHRNYSSRRPAHTALGGTKVSGQKNRQPQCPVSPRFHQGRIGIEGNNGGSLNLPTWPVGRWKFIFSLRRPYLLQELEGILWTLAKVHVTLGVVNLVYWRRRHWLKVWLSLIAETRSTDHKRQRRRNQTKFIVKIQKE